MNCLKKYNHERHEKHEKKDKEKDDFQPRPIRKGQAAICRQMRKWKDKNPVAYLCIFGIITL